MENNSIVYKEYSIFIDIHCPNNKCYVKMSEKQVTCSIKTVDDVKLLIDGWVYPKEFNNKLDILLDD